MVITTEIGTGALADLVKQVQAGNEVLLTQGNKPVVRFVPFAPRDQSSPQSPVVVEIRKFNGAATDAPLRVQSLKGHRVLTPGISQEDLADEMFNRQ